MPFAADRSADSHDLWGSAVGGRVGCDDSEQFDQTPRTTHAAGSAASCDGTRVFFSEWAFDYQLVLLRTGHLAGVAVCG